MLLFVFYINKNTKIELIKWACSERLLIVPNCSNHKFEFFTEQ